MPSRYLLQLIKAFVFYLVLFALCRVLFLLYFAGQVMQHGVGVFFLSLYKALPLDISTASYLLLLPSLLLLPAQFSVSSWWTRLLRIYLLVTAFIYAVLAMVEIVVYRELHVKLYFNLLMHVRHLDELVRTVSTGLLVLIVVVVAVLVFICYHLVKRLFPIGNMDRRGWSISGAFGLVSAFIVVSGLLFLGCRGGLKQIPINEGEVYFSDNQCVNDATVNSLWSIVHSFIENRQALGGNIYKVMPDDEANRVVNNLFHVEKDTTVHWFKTSRPNVCILILESWSDEMIASCGGYQGLTPNFEKLVSNGYLFTHVEAAGHMSDQGVPAILSGYPALPIGSAINQPERQVDLPNINNQLAQAAYYSSFFYGGQLIFGNIKSYIYRNHFNRVMEQQDFPSSIPTGSLGINDSIMLGILLDSMQHDPQPFLSCLFTLSTHLPFDEPGPRPITWGDKDQNYLNSIVYADRQLGRFFDEAKKEGWYTNTIFILVADHSHTTPKNYPFVSPRFYHIPILICGGALKDEFRGLKDARICSQTDIAATLLHQLGLDNKAYHWSKDLANPYTRQFAFYTFDEGFGFVDTTGTVLWNKRFPSQDMNTGKAPAAKDSLNQNGEAMLQVLMNDFLSK